MRYDHSNQPRSRHRNSPAAFAALQSRTPETHERPLVEWPFVLHPSDRSISSTASPTGARVLVEHALALELGAADGRRAGVMGLDMRHVAIVIRRTDDAA